MSITLNPNLARGLHRPQRMCGVLSNYVRFMAGCDTPKGEDRCPKPLAKFPCGMPDMPEPPKKKPAGTKVPSMWLNPFCEPEDPYCPFNPRFDDIYYVESDKAKRKYWQTWVACPPIQIKPKKICCFANAKAAPVKRRKPAAKPVTACEQECPKEKDEGDCPKLARRCHRDGRKPPSCKPDRRPSNCVKPLTPYPSYSECQKPKMRPLPPVECLCLKTPMMCEVWARFRQEVARKTK
ncbi:hypothetical protein KR032_007348 [Drosophila birchii]|nr:hypothetical protein KR032_007348 [Drosophila birchii]